MATNKKSAARTPSTTPARRSSKPGTARQSTPSAKSGRSRKTSR